MFHTFSRFLCFLVLKVFCGIEVCGKENIPKSGGFLLASNHVSFLDPVAIGVASPRKLNYMARHDLFKNPLFAWILLNVGAFPVKRHTADLGAIKEAMKRVNNAEALLLFPEGRRKGDADTPEISAPQAGVGFLAAKLNVPVVPAFVKGTDKALPKGTKFIKPKKVTVYFGKQILIERGMPYHDFATIVMVNIRHLSCQ